MNTELITGLALFALVSSITPGPNNLMLMSSGANFGLRRTVPHLLGVAMGFVLMVILVGTGLSGVFARHPQAHFCLQLVSVLYLGWLALRLVRAAPPTEEGAADPTVPARPLSFGQAALFQWVNPKSWAMALTAVTVYAPTPGWMSVVVVAMIFGVINLPSVGLWALLGQHLRQFLNSGARLRQFNAAMATLLVVSLLPLTGLM